MVKVVASEYDSDSDGGTVVVAEYSVIADA